MATGNIVLSKTRQSIVAYLESAVTLSEAILDGKSATQKEAPCVIVNAIDAVEDVPGTGNFWVGVEVAVKTMAATDAGGTTDETKEDSEALVIEVVDALASDSLPADLTSALADFTCFGVGDDTSHESGEDEDCWVDTVKLRLLVCARSF